MNKLIFGNLVHRPLRSVISAFAVAIEVIMILSVVAIFYGVLNGNRTETTGIGMDMLVHPGAATERRGRCTRLPRISLFMGKTGVIHDFAATPIVAHRRPTGPQCLDKCKARQITLVARTACGPHGPSSAKAGKPSSR